MAANITELFLEMHSAIKRYGARRKSTDPQSPQQGDTLEALPGSQFTLNCSAHNVNGVRPFDKRWAIANTLHFFARTEEASVLRRYNKRADRFLTGCLWIGAYGAAMMCQLECAIQELQKHSSTRRGIATMGDLRQAHNINMPQCWNLVHFLEDHGRLDMLVYQRSLNLANVFCYDAVQLTNIHVYAASKVGIPAGRLVWTCGSLHWPLSEEFNYTMCSGSRTESMLLPPSLLAEPAACVHELEHPSDTWYGRTLREDTPS